MAQGPLPTLCSPTGITEVHEGCPHVSWGKTSSKTTDSPKMARARGWGLEADMHPTDQSMGHRAFWQTLLCQKLGSTLLKHRQMSEPPRASSSHVTSPIIMLVMLQGKRMWGAWHVERCPVKGVIPFLRVFYPSVFASLNEPGLFSQSGYSLELELRSASQSSDPMSRI